MNLMVLVSTMHQIDHSLLEKMNLQTDAVVVNQCDRYEVENITYKENSVRFFSAKERGVGLSRNTALLMSAGKSDISLFADDDIRYVDDYERIIIEAFERSPEADMIIFNVPSVNGNRQGYTIKKHERVRWFNSLRYGTFRIAIRTDKNKFPNIYFSLLFGGGAKYSHGEDSIFIIEYIQKGLKVYADPSIIGYVDHKESTWFKGYTEQYFIDSGALYANLSKRWAKLLCLQFVIRHRKLFDREITAGEAYGLMLEGVKNY